MTDTLPDKLRQMVARSDDELDALWEAADEIEQLTAERDEARRGEHRENEHMPTWAELTAYWKARAEKLEAALREIAILDAPGGIPKRGGLGKIARAALGEEK